MDELISKALASKRALMDIYNVVEIDFLDHGIQCEDGHWMSPEELDALTDEEIVKTFISVYGIECLESRF